MVSKRVANSSLLKRSPKISTALHERGFLNGSEDTNKTSRQSPVKATMRHYSAFVRTREIKDCVKDSNSLSIPSSHAPRWIKMSEQHRACSVVWIKPDEQPYSWVWSPHFPSSFSLYPFLSWVPECSSICCHIASSVSVCNCSVFIWLITYAF